MFTNLQRSSDKLGAAGVFHATVRAFVKFLVNFLAESKMVNFLAESKDERNRRYCEKCIVIGSQSHEIVYETVHEHGETRETISV